MKGQRTSRAAVGLALVGALAFWGLLEQQSESAANDHRENIVNQFTCRRAIGIQESRDQREIPPAYGHPMAEHSSADQSTQRSDN